MTKPDIICIGSVLWDMIGRSQGTMDRGHDRPGRITQLPGGVAMNIGMTLARFDFAPALLSVLGTDRQGDALFIEAQNRGMIPDYIYRSAKLPTDRYMAIEDASGMVAAVADARSLEIAGSKILEPLRDGRLGSTMTPWSGLVAIDGNLTTDLLSEIARDPCLAAADLRIAPASPGKARRLLALRSCKNAVFYLNRIEAGLILEGEFASASEAASALIDNGFHAVVVTDGPDDAVAATQDTLIADRPPQVTQARVTGAGDTFMAAHIAAEFRGASQEDALKAALDCAAHYVSGEK